MDKNQKMMIQIYSCSGVYHSQHPGVCFCWWCFRFSS